MAKELSVKVKVKLDTTKSSLEDELKKVTEYTQKNPVTIDVKVNKTSLKKSLDEAFGKGAAKSLENIQKQAKSASNAIIETANAQEQLSATAKTTNNNTSEQKDKTKQLTRALNDYISAARSAASANADMAKFSANGSEDNVEVAYDKMISAADKMGEAASRIHTLIGDDDNKVDLLDRFPELAKAVEDVYIENVTGDIDIDVVLIQTFQIFGAYQNVIRSNEGDVVGYGGTFECTYTPQSGYNAVSITVKKGDITGTVVDDCVTGNTVRIENVKSNYYIMANGYKVENWDVTYDLTNATSSNSDATVELNGSYKTTISRTDPYRLKSVTVTMDDVDISNDVVTWESGKYGILTYNNATIKIPEVTGKLNISVVGSMMYSMLKKTSDCKTTNETSIGIIAGQVWDGDTYFCAYVPSSGYTSCNIKVYKGSDSTGEEVTNSVVGKTTIDGVTYDSVTIKNVKQVYYTDASGVK